MAASPTLLEAAGMITKSPWVTLASSISAPYAVTNIIQTDAASANVSDFGCFTTAWSGATITSPYVKYWFIENDGITLTSSPTAILATPGPTASTTQAASYPRPAGNLTGSM